jgi:hypothetical protein
MLICIEPKKDLKLERVKREMEILPKNVINKIFFFLQHPAAKILEEEEIFIFMRMRLTPEFRYKGSQFECAKYDRIYHGAYYNPRKYTMVNGRRHHTEIVTIDEAFIYSITHNHVTPFVHYQWGLVTEWNIRGYSCTMRFADRGRFSPEGTYSSISSDYSETDTDSDTDSD